MCNGGLGIKSEIVWMRNEFSRLLCMKEDLTMEKQLPIGIIQNDIHYSLHGDYYFPNLEHPEAPYQTIGSMEGCARNIWRAIALACLRDSSRAICMITWQKSMPALPTEWSE